MTPTLLATFLFLGAFTAAIAAIEVARGNAAWAVAATLSAAWCFRLVAKGNGGSR